MTRTQCGVYVVGQGDPILEVEPYAVTVFVSWLHGTYLDYAVAQVSNRFDLIRITYGHGFQDAERVEVASHGGELRRFSTVEEKDAVSRWLLDGEMHVNQETLRAYVAARAESEVFEIPTPGPRWDRLFPSLL